MNPKTIELVLRQFALLFIVWMIGFEILNWFVESIKNETTDFYQFLNQYGAFVWGAILLIYFQWKSRKIIKETK